MSGQPERKRIRVVSYAINGRGMGHLVRQLAILRAMRRICAVLELRFEPWILTSSEADTLARREGFCALKMPSKAMVKDAGLDTARFLRIARTWVLNTVAGLQPDLLVVDTFPGGSFGELLAALELAPHRALVARRVKSGFAEQESYAGLLPLYQEQIHPDDSGCGPILIRSREELLARDQARSQLGVPDGARAIYLSVGGGGDLRAPEILPKLVQSLRGSCHLVVGAGPLYQGPELRGPGITWLSRYVPMAIFNGLDGAVSAGGYNSFHELMHAGVPTVFLPQPRIADDQGERVMRAVNAGAGLLATGLSQVPGLVAQLGPAHREAALALVPENGATRAAVQCLRGLVRQSDLDWALAALPPGIRDAELPAIRLLGGVHPGQSSSLSPEPALVAERLDKWRQILAVHQPPDDLAWSLLQGIARKFPLSERGELIAGAELLFKAWAPFDDWMGALSLLRAIPTQRQLSVTRFGVWMEEWLLGHEDLFDALRDFSRLEQGGKRTVSEVMLALSDHAQRGDQ
ncbi:MAG: UDP-N-acetylglucosamine--N-acetylmuramyl-(pentapeptide) pyrophosphoryl-undecaprenol N-acetylglucosamine transferase [Cognaticolwellia sp.]